MAEDRSVSKPSLEVVAGNGLLHRRLFLSRGAALLGGGGIALMSAQPADAAPLEIPEWMKMPGSHMSAYGQPSEFEQDTQRVVGGTPGVVGSGVSFTPHHRLHGTITPAPGWRRSAAGFGQRGQR